MGFDVCEDFANLPGCEAPTRNQTGGLSGLWRDLRAFRLDCVGEVKNRPGALNIVLYDLRLILQGVTYRVDECSDGASEALKRIVSPDNQDGKRDNQDGKFLRGVFSEVLAPI